MHQHKKIGNSGEVLALDYLKNQGLELVQTNFYSRFGEIDIIMRDNDSFVFVEVKQRKDGINHAADSITYAKQKKLIRTAQYFLMKIGRDVNCRFDAILIDSRREISWLKNIIIL